MKDHHMKHANVKAGNNQIEITNPDRPKGCVIFFSLELAFYK